MLDKSVYNRIAAGEVVERPFSIVKELIENSVDAGATDITVSLTDGGKKCVTVTDNGSGIAADDLIKALMPHATSKISTADDLNRILTLGFRGEALASIAAVSRVTIISKTADEEHGYTIYSDCGETGDVKPYPTENGTIIKAEDLFCNTPARQKFLKPAKTEESDISNVITRTAFAHPNISFKLIVDGKETLRTSGGILEDAVIDLYGYEAIKESMKIDAVKNGIHVQGFIGNAYFAKPNRSYQTLILNGRYIINSTIQSAIHNAYAPYLMKRKYPLYVLTVDMAPEFVDVNVHPNKTDVRFVDNQVVYATLFSLVSSVLEGNASAIDVVMPNGYDERTTIEIANEHENRITDGKPIATLVDSDKPIASMFVGDGHKFNFSLGNETSVTVKEAIRAYEEDHKEYLGSLSKPSLDDIFAENKRYAEELEAKRAFQSQLEVPAEFKVVGQVLKTYLILERGEDIYFIDQHAAHERLLFDKLMLKYQNNDLDAQALLVPYHVNANEKESDFIIDHFKDFRDMGFEISEYAEGTFAVYALPLTILDMDLQEFFDDVLSDLNSLKQINSADVMREKIAQKACKAAIKSGKSLSQSEIDALLEKLNGDMGLKCPHGRPIAIKITRTEIDKWFKRIV